MRTEPSTNVDKPKRPRQPKKAPVKNPSFEKHIILKGFCIGPLAFAPKVDAKGKPNHEVKISVRHIERLRNQGIIK